MTRRVIRHPEHDIRELCRLADRPVEQGDTGRRIDSRGINDDVLEGDVEVDRSAMVRVLAVDDMVVGEVRARLQHGRIDRITNHHGPDVQLDAAFHEVGTRGEVHDGGLTGRAHGVLAAVGAVGCAGLKTR